MCIKNHHNFAVIGHPIGHTMSPFIHERLFQLSQTSQASYIVMDIRPEELADKMPLLRELEGFNITIPHKQAIIPLLDRCSPQAAAFGSVNTVHTQNGISTGYTTDGIGCLKALEACGISPVGTCLMLGSGGAARAIAFALTDVCSHPQITFAVREGSMEKARSLCSSLADYAVRQNKTGVYSVIGYQELENLSASPNSSLFFDLLLNCTSVGMYPKTTDSPVSKAVIARCGAVFDAVYNPHETKLLKTAQELGIPVIHGMAMLVWQAVAAHQIWDGSEYRLDDIQQLIEDTAAEMQRRFQEGQP